MSRAVICDVCGNICQSKQYFSLRGWLGKGEHYPVKRQKKQDEGWEVIERKDISGLTADVCPGCMSDRIGIAQFNREKTRETLIQEIQAKDPKMSGLKLLRLSGGSVATSVTCDLCQQNCIDKHLKLTSGWLTPEGEELTLEICESCTSSRLSPIVCFQSLPAKTRAVDQAAG